MSKSHDNLLDRLLGYAPYVAATLVGICFLALIVRMVTNRGEESGRPETVASAAKTDKVPRSPSVTPPQPAPRADMSSAALQEGPQYPAALQGRRVQPEEPQTPSSKSRLEIHGVRSGSIARQTDRKLAGRTTVEASGASQKQILGAAKSGASSTEPSVIETVTRHGYRAASPDGRGHTSFFGVEAAGRRFVYVLDRSGSMGNPNNKPLLAAKEELLASLARLDSLHQFFLIFYNERPTVFNPGAARQLVFADELNKRSARRFVESIQAQGGTKHYEALLKAVSLRPDVIFLLTDGEAKDDLTADEVERLKRLNEGIAQIHVVQFTSAPYAGNSLVRLANENRGQHTYKSVRAIVE